MEMQFTAESMWLKDFYISQVRGELRPTADHEG
jgi:hypothetical protein